jgi:hypothetical protein
MIKSREMQEARHVARVGENKNAYIGFVGKPGEKKRLNNWWAIIKPILTPMDVLPGFQVQTLNGLHVDRF